MGLPVRAKAQKCLQCSAADPNGCNWVTVTLLQGRHELVRGRCWHASGSVGCAATVAPPCEDTTSPLAEASLMHDASASHEAVTRLQARNPRRTLHEARSGGDCQCCPLLWHWLMEKKGTCKRPALGDQREGRGRRAACELHGGAVRSRASRGKGRQSRRLGVPGTGTVQRACAYVFKRCADQTNTAATKTWLVRLRPAGLRATSNVRRKGGLGLGTTLGRVQALPPPGSMYDRRKRFCKERSVEEK